MGYNFYTMYELRIKEVKRSDIRSKTLWRIAHAPTPISKYFLATYMFQDVGVVHIGVQEPPGSVFIYYLYVLTEFRGMRFGAELVNTVEQFARENGNLALELEPGQIDLDYPVNQVRAWYQRRGYQPLPEDDRKFKKYLSH